MIFRNVSEHFAMPVTEVAMTASKTSNVTPAGVQANSSSAQYKGYAGVRSAGANQSVSVVPPNIGGLTFKGAISALFFQEPSRA